MTDSNPVPAVLIFDEHDPLEWNPQIGRYWFYRFGIDFNFNEKIAGRNNFKAAFFEVVVRMTKRSASEDISTILVLGIDVMAKP
jgi:hypothetical protein